MKYFRETMEFSVPEPSAIALGKFDGLHRGHRSLLRALEDDADDSVKRVVFTFDVPPRALTERDWNVLLTNREKERIFSEAGIDVVVECPFTETLKNREPEEFLRFLCARINVKRIVAGTDFRFGRARSGGPEDLFRLEKELGYRTVIVEKQQEDGRDISSTRIREHIAQGEMEEANRLLGYPYFLFAPVVRGSGLGHTWDIPTVNQVPAPNKLLPPYGVYASLVTIDGETHFGVSDIGCKPTIEGKHPVGVETHLFDFDREIYGREIRVSFLSHLRPERSFGSVEELREQIREDCRMAKAICDGMEQEA